MGRIHGQAQACARLIEESSSIVVLTGAGISTNAGIPDFRGPKGLYITRRYDPETVFDLAYFLKDPRPFYSFARDFVELERTIKPTFAHIFLTQLEQRNQLKGIITQNIDSLHQQSGAKKVLELHGSFWRSHCLECGKMYPYGEMKEKILKERVPLCPCGGLIKPDVVFFGEDVKYFDEAVRLASQSDLFFVVGTSCVVFPAAMIPLHAGGKIVVMNKGTCHLEAGNIELRVDYDIDQFFTRVAHELNREVTGGGNRY